MRPSVSIIIPAYNAAPFIEQALDSALSQKGAPATEVIVVDDCSVDGTRDIVSRREGVRLLLNTHNSGPSVARNRGIQEAKGEYVYFMDADDLITDDAIATLWELVERHPGINMVCGQMTTFPDNRVFDNYINLERKGVRLYDDNPESVRKAHFFLPDYPVNKLLNRKWILDNDLFFREGIQLEDGEWHFRCYGLLDSYATSPGKPTYLYRMVEQSRSNRLDKLKRRRAHYKFLIDDLQKVESIDSPLRYYLAEVILEYKRVKTNDPVDVRQQEELYGLLREKTEGSLVGKLWLTVTKHYPDSFPRRFFLWLV